MALSHFERATERYSDALIALEKSQPQLNEELIFNVLVARDAIHRALKNKPPENESAISLATLVKLDERLKKHTRWISQQSKLADWRASLEPPLTAWWWFCEPPTHPQDRFDWIWSALAIAVLTISLSVLLDISGRFLSIGPDGWAAFAVIGQSVLAMLTAGGILTKIGREGLERILTSLRISKHYCQEIRLTLALLFLLILISLRLSLPRIAIFYNNRGLTNYLAGHVASARFDYERAIKLNPDYLEAHYNLGLLYEDQQDFTRAKIEYQIAVQGGLDAAYNNLARLYILDGKYSAAIPLLLIGLDKVIDIEIRYDLLKNFGWSRFQQQRYAESENLLRSAIATNATKAPAHCLLAQMLDASDRPQEAKTEWQECLKYSDARRPDEDTWIGQARQQLEGQP